MILCKTLKRLLREIPDDAQIDVYEGEDIGINISFEGQHWWIRARPFFDVEGEEDDYTKGFKMSDQEEKAQ